MRVLKRLICVAVIFVMLHSCGSFCGSLDASFQRRIDSANSLLKGRGHIEPVPCEFFYVNFRMSTAVIDSDLVAQVHSLLYDDSLRAGWPVVWIYDDEGRYILSHHFKGRFYRQTGD